jgi:hypothetical protein
MRRSQDVPKIARTVADAQVLISDDLFNEFQLWDADFDDRYDRFVVETNR